VVGYCALTGRWGFLVFGVVGESLFVRGWPLVLGSGMRAAPARVLVSRWRLVEQIRAPNPQGLFTRSKTRGREGKGAQKSPPGVVAAAVPFSVLAYAARMTAGGGSVSETGAPEAAAAL